MTSRSEGEEEVYIIVTTCDVGEGVKGSDVTRVTSVERHNRQPNSCCQLAVGLYVRTRNIRNTVLNFTQFYALD